jgi:hypothetical protein
VRDLAPFPRLGSSSRDRVDSERLKRTEHAVEAYRAQFESRKPENYGFASMAAVPYAHVVAQLLERKRPKGTTITLAPNPKDIVSRSHSCVRHGYAHRDLHRYGKT